MNFLSPGKGNLILSQRGIRSIRVRVNRVKKNERWDEFHWEIGLSSSSAVSSSYPSSRYRGSTLQLKGKISL